MGNKIDKEIKFGLGTSGNEIALPTHISATWNLTSCEFSTPAASLKFWNVSGEIMMMLVLNHLAWVFCRRWTVHSLTNWHQLMLSNMTSALQRMKTMEETRVFYCSWRDGKQVTKSVSNVCSNKSYGWCAPPRPCSSSNLCLFMPWLILCRSPNPWRLCVDTTGEDDTNVYWAIDYVKLRVLVVYEWISVLFLALALGPYIL